MTIEVGTQYVGQYANLYYYNPQTGKLEAVSVGKVSADGHANLAFTHASDYVIVFDTVAVKVAPSTSDNNMAVMVLFLCVGALVVVAGLKKKSHIR